MDDQYPPSPAPPDDTRTTSPLRQSDYEAIESAVMETAKGRWFLAEFARRNRAADTEAVLAAVARLERLVRRERPGDRASERPSETERMHLDLAEIRDVINRNTSGPGAPVAEALPGETLVPDHAADDDAAGDVEAKSPGISGDNAGLAEGDVHPAMSVVAVDGENESEEAGERAGEAVTTKTSGVVDSAGPAPVAEASDSASTVADPPSPLRSDPPVSFIETPVPKDLADDQADELGNLADESDALARANAAMDDAIETLRGVSGAVAGPPPSRLPDPRIDPIAALPRAERLALFS